MTFAGIHCQKKEHVAVLSMDMQVKDMEEMTYFNHAVTDICDDIMEDSEIRVIVLTSNKSPTFFVAEDVISNTITAQEKPEKKFFSLAECIAGLDQPVIAGIGGDAVAQGLELALACDIRIADETSRFGLPHVKEGLIPWDGGTQRLSRLVGRGKAMELLLLGETIDAQEALRIGLVNKIVTSQELRKTVMTMAHEMASKAPLALRYAKETVHKGIDLNLEQGLRLEADLYLLLHTTQDRTKGIKAFQERQEVQFEGR